MSRLPSLDALFDEQRRLQFEDYRIRQRLTEIDQQIHYLLMRHAQMETLGERPVTVLSEKRPVTGPAHRGARAHQRHQWFARGETAQLMRRVLKGAMRPAQVVHAVMEAKGYAGNLSVPDRKKVEAALHQAVINAVKTKVLAKDSRGFVRLRRFEAA